MQKLNHFVLTLVLFFYFSAKGQTNNYIVVYQDDYNGSSVIPYADPSKLNPWFNVPNGPPVGNDIPEGPKAFILNFKAGTSGLVFDDIITVCPGASYYFKFFIGNECVPCGLKPSVTITVKDGGTTVWTQNYTNINYAYNEITTATFTAATSTVHFQLYNNVPNPSDASGNDAVFDNLRLYQNNPYYNYQVATGTSGVNFCISDAPSDLANYLYWPMSSGTWSGPSTLPNPNGTFNPATDAAGLYTFTNNNTGVCPDTSSMINVNILATPNITPISDYTSCGGSYTFPSITGSSIPGTAKFYTGSLGTGTAYSTGQTYSSTGTTTFYAYAQSGSCYDQDTFLVHVQAPAAAGNDVTTQFCSSSSSVKLDTIIGTTQSGAWSETSGTPSGNFTAGTSVFNISSTTPGVYTFEKIVTGTNPCPNDTAHVTITINNPVINPISNQTVCENYTLPAISGSNLSGNQAYYTGSNGTGTSYAAGSNISSSQTLYAYDVMTSDPTCSVQQSFSITVNQQNSAGTNYSNSFCSSFGAIDMDTLLISENAGGTWSNTSGSSTTFNAGTGTISTTGEAQGSYTFQYFIASTAPCVNDTASVSITINDPSINAISNQTVCEGYVLQTIAGSNLTGGQSYYSGANGTGTNYAVGDTISTSTTLYAYDVMPTDATCYTQQSFTVTVNQQQSAGNDFTNSYCSSVSTIDLDTLISGQDAGGTWTNVAGSSATFNAAGPSVNPSGENEGSYVFQYIVNSTAPCVNDTSYATVNVLETPQINLSTNDSVACAPGTFSFSSGTSNNSNFQYAWNFSDGGTASGMSPTHTFSSVGCYNVSLTVTNTGGLCSQSASKTNMVCVIASPSASFTTDQDTLTPSSNTLTGTNTSTGGTSYLWNYGDGLTDTTFALNHSYDVSSGGEKTILLVVKNSAGCSDTAQKTVFILNEVKITLPNVFTPNGDKSNDLFTVEIEGVKHVDWNIFNRWGNLMTSGSQDTGTDDQKLPLWDGGNAVDGVYFITLRYTSVTGDTKDLHGSITLLKK